MLPSTVRRSALSFLLAAGLLSIMTLGGCPVAQTPTTPSDQQEDQGTQPAPTTPDEGLNRPIPPPPLDDETITTGGGGSVPTGPGAGGGGGGAGEEPETVFVSIDQPGDPLAVRPGTIITVAFNLIDLTGAVQGGQLVIADDEDSDGQPDGDPVLIRDLEDLTTGSNSLSFNTQDLVGRLGSDQFGRFVFGIRVSTIGGEPKTAYSPATVTIDGVWPTAVWLSPTQDHLLNRDVTWEVRLNTTDNSPHSVQIFLERVDTGVRFELVPRTTFPAGADTRTFNVPLAAYPAGTYYYYVIVSDGVQPGPAPFYAPETASEPSAFYRLGVTNRLIGQFDLSQLANSASGAILQGFNFNDLAGSSITGLPDIDGDGDDEIVVASRYGKPYIINNQGIGFGEAYLIYGGENAGRPGLRLRGVHSLNAVGRGNVAGLAFPGIRFKMNEIWSEGLSDVTYVPDMDGDGLPELVFAFPRVEALSLADPAFISGVSTPFQHPDLVADLPGMGSLEASSVTAGGTWINGVSQFARGGIVIVSSHNAILADPALFNRKGDRLLDLHEVGQLFNSMFPPSLDMYVRKTDDPEHHCFNCEPEEYDENNNCTSGCGCDVTGDPQDPNETEYTLITMVWDNYFVDQGPGGFCQQWNLDLDYSLFEGPALANARVFPLSLPMNEDPSGSCDDQCVVWHRWYGWYEEAMCMLPLPGSNIACGGGWQVPGMPPLIVWTGFYGPACTPTVFTDTGNAYPAPVGARVLGQSVEDHLGASIAADELWLYIAAPERTARAADVPALEGAGGDRDASGVVYMYRVSTPTAAGEPTRSQLWIEPGMTWPNVDAELPERVDDTMPVPHQYVIERVGSVRGLTDPVSFVVPETECTPEMDSGAVVRDAEDWYTYLTYPNFDSYPVGTSGYCMDTTPQIVGPHPGARIAFVRTLGDLNGDGIGDFAVGSANVKSDVANGTGDEVGALFIVYGRSTGLEGDYLLERLALDPAHQNRLHGVLLKGSSPQEKLARTIDAVGDFNGDGYNDVVVGSENSAEQRGQAIVIFGSPTLESPAGGWTVNEIVAAGRAIRFVGENPGDHAGANVAGIGDVDADGLADIAVCAPDAAGGRGAVYLIYGLGATTAGELELAAVGTVTLPGAKFLGRVSGDRLGGGSKTYTGTSPVDPARQVTAYSRGVARLGDIDGDGRDDYAIGAMLADPNQRTDAGEVYILYGRGD